MKVALIVDVAWLRHEARLLKHLAIGLTDESVRIVSILPDDHQFQSLSLLGERVDYHPARVAWLNQWRLQRLKGDLAERGIDLLHCLDGRLAGPTRALAEALGVPAVCSVWSMEQAEEALANGLHIMASSRLIADSIAPRATAGQRVTMVHPGVMRPNVQPPLRDPQQALTCLVILDGPVDAAANRVLESLAQAAARLPQLQAFVYCSELDTHRLWRTINRLNLLDRLNLVGPDDGSQSLAVRADVVMIPQPIRTIRTIGLATMAAARPIFAAPSDVADYLIDGQTARLVEASQLEVWANALDLAVAQPEAMIALGLCAQAHARAHFGPAAYVNGVLEAYRQAVGEPLKFEA